MDRNTSSKPIFLYVELDVDPANEKAMLDHFHNKFVPEARKHAGFIDLRLLKLRTAIQNGEGTLPYRFSLVFESEELRQKWIHSPEHSHLWPVMEKLLKNQKDYPVVLYDEV
jgi:hypothetical protein